MDFTRDIGTGKRQIADAVENLVPHAFVVEAETILDNRAILAEHQEVAGGRPQAQPLSPKCVHLGFENERPCGRDVLEE